MDTLTSTDNTQPVFIPFYNMYMLVTIDGEEISVYIRGNMYERVYTDMILFQVIKYSNVCMYDVLPWNCCARHIYVKQNRTIPWKITQRTYMAIRTSTP